jgi:hypothetical protein
MKFYYLIMTGLASIVAETNLLYMERPRHLVLGIANIIVAVMMLAYYCAETHATKS